MSASLAPAGVSGPSTSAPSRAASANAAPVKPLETVALYHTSSSTMYRSRRPSRSRRTSCRSSSTLIALEMDAALTRSRWTSSAEVMLPESAVVRQVSTRQIIRGIPICMSASVNRRSNSATAAGSRPSARGGAETTAGAWGVLRRRARCRVARCAWSAW